MCQLHEDKKSQRNQKSSLNKLSFKKKTQKFEIVFKKKRRKVKSHFIFVYFAYSNAAHIQFCLDLRIKILKIFMLRFLFPNIQIYIFFYLCALINCNKKKKKEENKKTKRKRAHTHTQSKIKKNEEKEEEEEGAHLTSCYLTCFFFLYLKYRL